MRRVVDSHVHLWPGSAADEDGHRWMKPGMPLAKEHLLQDYYLASRQLEGDSSDTKVEGIVYVETDRRYEDGQAGEIDSWAGGPLKEIKFLRSIVEGPGRDGDILAGIVLWAPLHCTPHILSRWLEIAQKTAGPNTWKRVKGFRYLLQAITKAADFEKLVLSDDFVENLKLLGKRGFSFDVGVDQHSGGAWQLEAIAQSIAKAHSDANEEEKVTIVLNHLCKPDFSVSRNDYDRWLRCMTTFSSFSRTYIKLSGVFSELPVFQKPLTLEAVARHIKDWISHVFRCFGPSRIMFGSDWPVCNLKGPDEVYSWVLWKDIVAQLLADGSGIGLDDESREHVWRKTAIEAYRL